MCISIRNRLTGWAHDHPAWCWAIGLFVAVRLILSFWAAILVAANPLLVSNLELFGAPVVAAFDLGTGENAAYSRVVGERALHFRSARPNLTDIETASVWNLSGHAISGTLAGASLNGSLYHTEDVFPYRGVPVSQNVLLSPWQRFDTNWYLEIAERGYAAEDGSTVYLPLYPLLIRLMRTLLSGNELLAALIVSNAALIGVLYLLYQIVADRYGPIVARRTLVYLLFFPTAFFLFAGYTESLFLLLAIAALREGERKHWGRAGSLAALAALTRLQGVLMILPLGYMWWEAYRRDTQELAAAVRQGAALLLVPLASAGFLGWQYLFVGNASLVGAYEGQLHARFVMPWDNIVASLALVADSRAGIADLLNLLTTALFAIMMVILWKHGKIPRAWWLYALAMFLAPMLRMTTTQPLVSMVRYVLVLFPVFVAWALWGQNGWVNRVVIYVGFPLALFLSAQFVMWGWVG